MYANFGQMNVVWNPAGQDVTEAIKQAGLPEPGDKPAMPTIGKTPIVTSEGAAVEDVGGEALMVDTSTADAVESKTAGLDISLVQQVPWYKNKWTWIAAGVVVVGGVVIWQAKKRTA